MNLLTDRWIPVQQDGKRQLIRLEDVLCREDEWQISLPRDDMEMACLQLIICLTQVIFTPDDAKALKQRIRKPLSNEVYQEGVGRYLDWFDLNHPDTPFMQTRGVSAKEVTPIQKLFVGLPEGKGTHCFFNDPGELTAVSLSAVAIALFNQAMNSPSFGGGFKGGLRGGAPVTTLIYGESLRQTIWFNVLHENSIRLILPKYDKLKTNDKPVWVEPIQAKASILASNIGFLRGLFWQPTHVELEFSGNGTCDFFGTKENILVIGFRKEKFGSKQSGGFDLIGQWVHPHSPRYWQFKKGVKEEKYLSFTTTAPAWTQMSRFVVIDRSKKEGQQPAAVVNQFQQMMVGKFLTLLVGGYRNKRASILQRRHELLPLREGWESHTHELSIIVASAFEIKQKLIQSLCLFGVMAGASKRNRKKNRAITPDGLIKYKDRLDEYPHRKFEEFFDGVHQNAETKFYHYSEHLIHSTLRQMNWREAAREKSKLVQKLIKISWDIFEQVIKPYQHEPKMILAIAVARRNLGKEFKKIKGDQV